MQPCGNKFTIDDGCLLAIPTTCKAQPTHWVKSACVWRIWWLCRVIHPPLLCVWTQTKRSEEEGWYQAAGSHPMIECHMTLICSCWRVTAKRGWPPLPNYPWALVDMVSWDPNLHNIFFSQLFLIYTTLWEGKGSHRLRTQEGKYFQRWVNSTMGMKFKPSNPTTGGAPHNLPPTSP